LLPMQRQRREGTCSHQLASGSHRCTTIPSDGNGAGREKRRMRPIIRTVHWRALAARCKAHGRAAGLAALDA
jgi:hypothetical protein